MSQAINSAKGRAVEALLTHALRVCRLADQTSGSHTTDWLAMQPTFDQELKQTQDGRSFEVSTLFAAHVAQLRYLDAEWVATNVRRIFALDSETNFACAIAGLAYASVSRPEYQLLSGAGVIDRALASATRGRQTRERLLEYVLLAYLWGDETVDSARVATVVDPEREEDAEHSASFLWSLRREELSPEQVDRVLTLWERLVARSTAGGEAGKKLLRKLPMLAPFVNAEDARGMRLLAAVAPYVDMRTSFEFFGELDRLADECAETVGEVMRLALAAFTPSHDYKDHLQSVIRKLAKSGQVAAALEFANTLRHLSGMRELYSELVTGSP